MTEETVAHDSCHAPGPPCACISDLPHRHLEHNTQVEPCQAYLCSEPLAVSRTALYCCRTHQIPTVLVVMFPLRPECLLLCVCAQWRLALASDAQGNLCIITKMYPLTSGVKGK